jgi:PAS domain S-box-containing protein
VRPERPLRWLVARGRAVPSAEGQPIKVVASLQDVTQLKRDAAALQAALAASRTGTFHWNIVTNELSWDDELHRLFGLGPAQTVRSLEQFLSLVHPDERAEVIRRCGLCRLEGADFEFEFRVVLPDGSTRWLYDRGVTFRDASGRPAAMTGACVDITARVTADRALELNRARLDYATRLSGVGFWYCDLPFDVLEWDERVKEHFFFPPEARITIDDFYARIHEDDRAPTREAIETSIRERGRYDIVYRTVQPITGAVKWIRALGGTDYAPDGTPSHFDGVTVDVTAQKLDQERLSLLNEQLRKEHRLKDEFIATLSHELRNPLAPIRSAAQALSSPHLTEEQLHRAHTIIQRQVTNMALLLDDLLDIARITQGKLTIRKQNVALAEVIEVAVEAVRPALNASGHQLAVDLPPEAVELDGDPLRLSQILSNLLSNAAKYSAAGTTIELTAKMEGDGLMLSVRDEGIGIAPESLGSIFEMFAQVESGAGKRGDGGLGIGLALVKGLTELHGGTVEARSAGLRRGSEFVVRLPRVRSAARATVRPRAAASHASRLKIMIADDNEDAAESIGMLLALAGHEVQTAHSGEDALALAQQFRPDAALLDIGMPDLNGYEVARRLRQEAWGKELRLIALTGWGQASDRERALHSGFDHHLTKPVDPAVLERAISGVHAQPDSSPPGK